MPFPEESFEASDAAASWCTKLMTDKLSDAEYDAFSAWCDEGPEHRALLDDAIRAWQALDPISTSPGMIDLRSAALRNFRRAQMTVHARKHPMTWLAAASILLAIVGGTVGGGWLYLRPDVYKTADGERRDVTLDDGSRLSLDADTVVRVKYSKSQRHLWLDKGRADFEVAKNRDRPFTVVSGEKSVLATGTEFSVEQLQNEVRVVLYEGHISVFQQPTGAGSRTLLHVGGQTVDKLLRAGEELISTKGSDAATIVPVSATAPEWQNRNLVFDATPLIVAVERVNRYTQHKIVIAPGVNQATAVSGIYRAGDIDAFIDGVTTVSGLSFTLDNGAYVLEPRKK